MSDDESRVRHRAFYQPWERLRTWTRIEKACRVAAASPVANAHSTRLNAACAAGAACSAASSVRLASCKPATSGLSEFFWNNDPSCKWHAPSVPPIAPPHRRASCFLHGVER